VVGYWCTDRDFDPGLEPCISIIFRCPECDCEIRVPRDRTGQSGSCQKCGELIRVPAVDESIPDDAEVSESGSIIWRHEARTIPFQPTTGDPEQIERISDHIEEHLGPIATVFHEVVSDLVHIDVHVVAPTEERPWSILVTSGMSEAPMNVPEGAEEFRFAELMIMLPPEWPLSTDDFNEEQYYWPIRWLKMLARFPHEYDSWLGCGHTVPNGDPPEPLGPNTDFCCALILPPLLVPEEFHTLALNDQRVINFYSFIPLYEDEMRYKLKHGLDQLLSLFDEHEIDDVINIERESVLSDL